MFKTILSIDANFRLKNRKREESRNHPPLYSGLGLHPPVDMYLNFLRTYASEEDVRLPDQAHSGYANIGLRLC